MRIKTRIPSTTIQQSPGKILATVTPLLLAFHISAATTILHLKNGDRVAGEVVSENSQEIILNTPWAQGLKISGEQIERRESPAPPTNPPVAAASSPTNAPAPVPVPAVAATAKPVKPKSPNEWRFDAKLGADMIRGERDRDIYYGQLGLTYAHPYASNPRKFFRNKLDYRVDYSTTDGRESANRMFGSDKTDFDFGQHAYAYNFVGGGYDEVRRINSQIEAGPGLGYHLLREANFAADVEAGLTYQYQDREGAPELDALYGRVAQDCTWKVYPKITLTQRSSLLASLEDSEQLQFRLESTLSFGILQHLSLNLTAIELYDTRPVPGVSRNEFQLRSALGVNF